MIGDMITPKSVYNFLGTQIVQRFSLIVDNFILHL